MPANPDPSTAHARESGPGGHDPDRDDYSWMDRYSTGREEPDITFWVGFFVGVVACVAAAGVAMALALWGAG